MAAPRPTKPPYEPSLRELVQYEYVMQEKYVAAGCYELATQCAANIRALSRPAVDRRAEEHALALLDARHVDLMQYRPKAWDTMQDAEEVYA